MKPVNDLYDRKYSQISIYVIKTVLLIYILGLCIYNISHLKKPVFSFVSAVLNPLIMGLIFAYLLKPLADMIERKLFYKLSDRYKKPLAAGLTFVIVFAVVFFILTILVSTVTDSVTKIDFDNLNLYIESLQNDFSNFWNIIESKLKDFNINPGKVGSLITKVFGSIKSGASTVLFSCIFAIYFLLDVKISEYWKDILDLFVNDEVKAKMKEFIRDADRVFSGYIRGQSIDALLVGVSVTIVLLLFGIPYATVIGLLTGFGNLIPYVGPIIGFGSLIIVCLSEGSLTHLLAGGIVLGLVMGIDGNIVNPKLLSDSIEIHPVLVIVALIAGGQTGGIAGMLIAVPVAALIKLQFERLIQRKRKVQTEGNEEIAC